MLHIKFWNPFSSKINVIVYVNNESTLSLKTAFIFRKIIPYFPTPYFIECKRWSFSG
jgi:hypothetical protein